MKKNKKFIVTLVFFIVYLPLFILSRTLGPSHVLDFFRVLTLWGAMMTHLNIDFHEKNQNTPGKKNKNQIIANSVMVVILLVATILVFVL